MNPLRTLHRKLLRELWQMRLQMLSIALMVATGVMTVVTMNGSYQSLHAARDDYYQRARFADVWAPLVRAPRSLLERLARIPGISTMDARVTLLATLDLPDVAMPAQARFVSLPAYGRPPVNDIVVTRGRYIQPCIADEVIISDKFAAARALKPGDTVAAVINGRLQDLHIVGIASSAEHSYAVPPQSILPEYERFGVFWMSEDFLGPAFNMEGGFNEVAFGLDDGANVDAVIQQIDTVLEPYGGLGAYPRAEQLSALVLDNEMAELKVLGSVIPGIFLGVAVFLLHQVLQRLITTQRGEIAVLKAFGYTDSETGWHFLSFALLPALAGAAAGVAGGLRLGEAEVALYSQYFEIPGLGYRLQAGLLLVAVGLSVAGACSGALAAVRKAVRLPPAEAMRPEAPRSFAPGPLERLGLNRLLPAAGRMILRNLERNPLHALFNVVGIALALAILVVGLSMFDSIEFLMDSQFRQVQREDVALVFKEEVPEQVRHALAKLPDVTRVETWRSAPARLRNGHLEKEVAVTAMPGDSQLRKLVNRAGNSQMLPAEGLVLSQRLASNLRLRPGDTVAVEWLDGKRLHNSVDVVATFEDFIGMSVYMSKGTMNRLTGSADLVSGAWLQTSAAPAEHLYQAIKDIPWIASLSSPQEMLATFEQEMAKTLTVSAAFLLGFALIIAFGVVYNSARIALAERGRELTSLRVMGFYRKEVATLLLGEQALLTLLALPLGCALGYWLSYAITLSIESDTYRVPFVPATESFILAMAFIIVASLLSMLAVYQRLRRLDLVAVLKTRE